MQIFLQLAEILAIGPYIVQLEDLVKEFVVQQIVLEDNHLVVEEFVIKVQFIKVEVDIVFI
jgi:hypothetical protein